MALMSTMTDMLWTVRVNRWTWVYTFSRGGTVKWQDPFNGMQGSGTWRLDKGKMVTRWNGSTTTEEWDVPIDPDGATGTCHMKGVTYDLEAVARNYYLQPGDIVYSGEPVKRGNGTVATIIYDDEVRTGGTVAWICRNPGAIRDGDRFGAFKGKHLNIIKVGPFAVFPDETTGLMAVVKVLRGYGRVTINQAMHKYAPKGDGVNKPDIYAQRIASGMKMSQSAILSTMSDEQLLRMATLITGVETTERGTALPLGDPRLPADIRGRVARIK